MNTMYRVDFVLKSETDYARTEAMLDRHFNCEKNGFVRQLSDNTVSFGFDEQDDLKSIAVDVLDELLCPCFISVIWTDLKAWESIDLLDGYEWDRADKHCSAVYKSVFITSKYVDPEKIIDSMENDFDYMPHPYTWRIDGKTIEFSISKSKYLEEFYFGTWCALSACVPDCYTGVYWYDIKRGICDDLLKQELLGWKLAGCKWGANFLDEADLFPDKISMKAVYTIKDDCDYSLVRQFLDMIYHTELLDDTRNVISEKVIEYTSYGKFSFYCSHVAVYRAVNCFLRDCFEKVEFTVEGKGYDKHIDVLATTGHKVPDTNASLIKELLYEEKEQ